MGAFFVYILKSSVCLAVFYFFYRWQLSRETFHQFNRFALLGLLLLSVSVPAYELRTENPVEFQQTVMEWEDILISDSQVKPEIEMGVSETSGIHYTWQEVVLLIYLSGILFFFFRTVYSLIRMALLLRKCKPEKLGNGITLVIHESKLAPFSWMKYIVVSTFDLKEGGKEIIVHEQEHIRYYHSLDLLVAEVVILFQWFNPAAWFFKRELQNIHEYQADEAVLNKGIDAKQYQLLLIKKAVGSVCYHSLVNSFNHSKLKKRITMMLKRKSSRRARLKYLYILPLAAMVMAAFARPGISDELDRISELEVNDLVPVAEKKVSETFLKERIEVVPEVENAEQPGDLPVVNDTVLIRDTVFIVRRDTVVIPARSTSVPAKVPANVSVKVARMKEFLDCHPYAWIVVNQREMRAYEIHPQEYDDNEGTIIYYPLDMTKRFGKRAVGGVLLINTDEEFFKNVIVRNGSYEAALKAVKSNALILDGESVSPKLLKMVDPCSIRSIKIGDGKVKVDTDNGHRMKNFIEQHPDALIILKGSEIDAKDLKRTDYMGVRTMTSYSGDESAQFGSKAKNGALFIGVLPYHYQLNNRKEKGKMFVSSSLQHHGRMEPAD